MSPKDKKDKEKEEFENKIDESETTIVDLEDAPEETEEDLSPEKYQRQKKRRLKTIILVSVIVGALGLMWLVTKYDLLNLKDADVWKKLPFFAKKEEQAKKKEEQTQILPRVKVYKATKQDFKDVLSSIGSIQGISETNLKFETNGVVKSFNFREGDIVRRGEVIAELDHYDSELKVKFRAVKVEGAQTAVEAAQQKLETHKKLYDIGAIIEDKLEEVRLELEKAKAELKGAQIEQESAKSEVEKTYLLAPIDGVIGSKLVEPGEFVTSNTKVATIVEISSVYAEVGIIEKDLDKIEPGQKVMIKVDTYPDQDFLGEIENIAPTVGGSRTLTVKARIQNPENLLLPGMFTRVKITVYEKADTFVVPRKSVNSQDNQFSIFVIDPENKAVLTQVEVGHFSADYAQLDAGIKEGDQVVIEALSANLKDGADVEIVEVQEAL